MLLVKGWYTYDVKMGKGRKPLHSSEMQKLINNYSMDSPNKGKKLGRDEIVHRILFPLVNEGFKILEEGIASNPADIDIIYLYGYGFPAWKGTWCHVYFSAIVLPVYVNALFTIGSIGGPMFWADNYAGLANILAELNKLHQLYPGSEYFRPGDLLKKCVSMEIGVQEYYNLGYAKANSTGLKSKL